MADDRPSRRALAGAVLLTALPVLPLLLAVLSRWSPAVRGFCLWLLP
jgi:hypothetical protein